jgi:hypothetical protein
MDKRQGNFIEQHIEKAALVIGALVSGYILFAFVIRSPGVQYNQQTVRPGQIDSVISEKAEKLRQKLNAEPNGGVSYEPCSPTFMNMLKGSWAVDNNLKWPAPRGAEAKIERRYKIPKVSEINEVSVEHIRAAAYVPKEEITPESAGKSESYEVNDIDFVTVQGSFSLSELSDSFRESFAGESLPEEWRDTGLARPVFAAVGVQRQELGEDGNWSKWEDVPRAMIEPDKKIFDFPEDVKELPGGGIMVQILKLASPARQASLLQPEPYQIASGDDDWFPPTLHKKYLALLREKEAQDKRDEINATKEKEQTKRGERRPRTASPQGPAQGGDVETMMKAMGMGGAGGGGYPGVIPSQGTRPNRTVRERKPETNAPDKGKPAAKPMTESSISEDLDKMLLSKKDFSKLPDSITFWAYDDTVSPGETYRYRVRIGVFNPVAGTNEVRDEDKTQANKVILWGEFSEATDEVDIPKRLYFFPMTVNETTKSVEWTVSKYVMGYWHSEQFTTKRGDVIGKVTDVKEADKPKEGIKGPEQIDYTTGAVLVDVVTTQDWRGGKNLSAQPYFNVLYSFDGSEIEESAAKPLNWTEDLRTRYSEIKTQEKKPKSIREWGSASSLGKRTLRLPTSPGKQAPTGPAGPQGPETDEMMRMMMEMQRQMSPQQ